MKTELKSNGAATASLVCGIISLVLLWVPFVHSILAILAIVMGGSSWGKYKYGKAGAILGIISLVLIWGFLLILFMNAAGAHTAAAVTAAANQQ